MHVEDPLKKKTGLSLLIQQLVALFWKKCLFMKRNLLKFFFRVNIFNFKRLENMYFFLHFLGGQCHFITLIDNKSTP